MKLNKKGFTLVELLAVIVVLAVIMVIAIPTVIDSMNSAKKNSFVMYGQKMITAAMSKVQGDALDGVAAKSVYKFSELVASSGQYKGYVSYSNGNYTVSFYNADYVASAVGYDELEQFKKADCGSAQVPAICGKVAAASDSTYSTKTGAIDTQLSK